MPSNLICGQTLHTLSTLEQPDTFTSIKGSKFESLKYLTICRDNGELIAILEIGWNSINESRIVHDNKSYLSKKEGKII